VARALGPTIQARRAARPNTACSRRRPCDHEPPRLKIWSLGRRGNDTNWIRVDRAEINRRYNQIEMAATNSRDRMIEALRELPPDATVDDAIEQLMFLAKIEAGLTELDRGEGIPHDEVKRRLGL
jgi:predicted transcriptional regulator